MFYACSRFSLCQVPILLIAPARCWRRFFDSAVDAIVVIDARGLIEAFNPAAERLFGYSERDVVGQNVKMLMPPPYRDGARRLPGALPQHRRGEDHRHRPRGAGAAARRHHVSVAPVGRRDVGGRGDGSTRASCTTSPRAWQLEARLRASEERWRSIIESAVDAIIVIDSHGTVEAFNPGAERLFGYRESDVVGRNVSMLMPSPYREEHDGYLSRYLVTGEAKIIGVGREVTGRRADGSLFPLHLSVGEMLLGGERKFTGILHDLSSRVRMEEQLREQAALVRLGEMAAVIAHEVKNPLAGIRGAVQVIGGRLPKDSREVAGSRGDALSDRHVERV